MAEIRRLTLQDAEAFRDIRLQALGDYPESFGSSLEEEQHVTAENLRERWNRTHSDNHFISGAFENGELIGVAGFFQYHQNKSKHKGYIWGMYVKSDAQGNGIGTQIMEFVLQYARQVSGLEQVHLSVVGNQKAKLLYEKIGFKTYAVEERALKINGQYFDEHHMVYFL